MRRDSTQLKNEFLFEIFAAFCSFFFKAVRRSSPCFAYVAFLAYRAGYAIDEICGDACEMVSDLNRSIGS